MKGETENKGSRVRIAVLGKMNVGKSGKYYDKISKIK